MPGMPTDTRFGLLEDSSSSQTFKWTIQTALSDKPEQSGVLNTRKVCETGV